MENNWKGTKGEWKAFESREHPYQKKAAYTPISTGKWAFDVSYPLIAKFEEATENALLIADAGNVRQQINCSLPELLERFKAMEEVVRKSVEALNDETFDQNNYSRMNNILSIKTIIQ